MTKNKQRIPEALQRWIEARKRFRLSDAHVQMARELGMNPRKLGSLANHNKNCGRLPFPSLLNISIKGASARLDPIAFFPLKTESERLLQRRPKDGNVGNLSKFRMTEAKTERLEDMKLIPRKMRKERLSSVTQNLTTRHPILKIFRR
jgi:hypothetical protein